MAKNKPSASITIDADHDWQAQQDMRTLMDAHKIRADKARHKAAKAYAKKQLTAMQKVATGDHDVDTAD